MLSPRLFRYILLGELESLMKSISSALATQYPETLGEFTFEDIRSENLYQSWRCVQQEREQTCDGMLAFMLWKRSAEK